MPSKPTLSIFKCHSCGGEFKSKARYQNHVCGAPLKCDTPKPKKTPRPKIVKNDIFECEFCGKEYKSQASFEKHACEKKLRYINRDERVERTAFDIYAKWYRMTMYRDTTEILFIKSPSYSAFIDFAKFIIEVQPPQKWFHYLEWLVKKQVRNTDWCTQEKYSEYLRFLIRNETYENAIERSAIVVLKHCVQSGIEPRDFMAKVSIPLVVLWLETGRISPWILLMSDNKNKLMSRLSNEEATRMTQIIDVQYWNKKIDFDQKRKDTAKYLLRQLEI
jgi:hypothetical protein